MKKVYKILHQNLEGSTSSDPENDWNSQKRICSTCLQPTDRSKPWFSEETLQVHFRRHKGRDVSDLILPYSNPFLFATSKAKQIMESQGLPVTFRQASKIPLSIENTDYYEWDPQEAIYLVECANVQKLDIDRTQMEWQKGCPGCGRIYPLLHTVKEAVVIAPKGSDSRVFVLDHWPDSYLYISQDTLKEWKKLGLTGIESIKKSFGVLDLQ